MSNAISKSPSMAIDKPNQFPWKLYDMLHTAEKRNEEHIISWISGGIAFKVHNRDLFIEEYMKKMFNQTKFKSFQRQLNLWGFERVQNGPDKGSYVHPLFVKGRRDCCQRLTRVRLKRAADKAVAQHGVVDNSEHHYSPNSVASTTTESISTREAAVAAFPVAVAASSVVRAGNIATASPTSLLEAFVDVSRSSSSTTTIEASPQGASSQQQQFADLIHYHTSQRRREMIRNAAIGLRPDLSMTVLGAPLFATAATTSHHSAGDEDLQQGRLSDQQQQQQQEQSPQHQQQQHMQLPTQQLQHQQQEHQNVDMPIHHEQQQQSQSQTQFERQSKIEPREQQSRRISTCSGLEALLSVSAQRRREEELALLLGLSDHGEYRT